MSHDKVTRQRLLRQSRKAKQICVSCRKPSGEFAECVRCRAKKRYVYWKRKFFEGRKGRTLLSHYGRTTPQFTDLVCGVESVAFIVLLF